MVGEELSWFGIISELWSLSNSQEPNGINTLLIGFKNESFLSSELNKPMTQLLLYKD